MGIVGWVGWVNLGEEETPPETPPPVTAALPAPLIVALVPPEPPPPAPPPPEPPPPEAKPPEPPPPPAEPPAAPPPPPVAAAPPTPPAPPADAPSLQPPPAEPPAPAPEPKLAAVPPPPPAPELTPPAPTPAVVAPPARLRAPPAWTKYGRTFDPAEKRPKVVVVVGELGLAGAATEAAIQQLPAAITLAFSPYPEATQRYAQQARTAGHEVLLNLPMEPASRTASDPGPRALMTGLPVPENLERLDWTLSRATPVVGVLGGGSGGFTAATEALRPVLEELTARGLIYVDGGGGDSSPMPGLAKELGLFRAFADRVIDEEVTRAAIDARLGEIEAIARRNGVAVALASPYPVTFERLSRWLPTLGQKGLVLAPLSAAMDQRGEP